MGFVIGENDLATLKTMAVRERTPMYTFGEVINNNRFTFESKTKGINP
jgi:phosphoribosylformylglycinamidine synthase